MILGYLNKYFHFILKKHDKKINIRVYIDGQTLCHQFSFQISHNMMSVHHMNKIWVRGSIEMKFNEGSPQHNFKSFFFVKKFIFYNMKFV